MTKEKMQTILFFFKSLAYLKPYKGWTALCVLSCNLAAALSVIFPINAKKTLTAFKDHDGKQLAKKIKHLFQHEATRQKEKE